jgi:chemotaxis protein methyltransferase CheR
MSLQPRTASAPRVAPGSALSATDFQFLCQLVYQKTAIVLEEGKQYLVASRLVPLARQESMSGIAELVIALRSGRKAGLEARVMDAMTTNETSWFRDIHPFESLRTNLLPDLIEKRRATRELNLWCAAASSGQEPYSVAMLLRDGFPELANWRVRFLATDISPTMIEKAKTASYSQLEVNRGLPAQLLPRHFERAGGEYRLRTGTRQLVDFKLMNLVEPWPPIGHFDVVFLRNVLIYFDRDTKRKVLDQVRRVIRPDGYLVLGASETTFNIDDRWAVRSFGKTICYQPS